MDTLPAESWLERLLNRCSDNRWAWFPMFSLKPAPHECMTSHLLLTLSLYIYLPASLMGTVGMFFFARLLGFETVGSNLVAGAALVFPLTGALTYQYISAHFWNRRAMRMRTTTELSISAFSTHQLPEAQSSNPYLPPIDQSIATQAIPSQQFPLRAILYLHEILFCHGSLILLATYCALNGLFGNLNPEQLRSRALLEKILSIQGIVLLLLTVCLSRKQTWLGRRFFFLLKLLLGIAQMTICMTPFAANFLNSTSLVWPVEDVFLTWYFCCGGLTAWSACVQFSQPEQLAAPIFSRRPNPDQA